MNIFMNILIYIAVGLISGYLIYKYKVYRFKRSRPLEGRYGLIKNIKGTFLVKELAKTQSGMVKLECFDIVANRKYPTSDLLLDMHSRKSVIYISKAVSVDFKFRKCTIWIDEKHVDWFNNNVAISRERKFNRL